MVDIHGTVTDLSAHEYRSLTTQWGGVCGTWVTPEASAHWDAYDAARGRSTLARLHVKLANNETLVCLRLDRIFGMRFAWCRGGPLWLREPSIDEQQELDELLRRLNKERQWGLDFIRLRSDAPGTRPCCQHIAYDTTVVLDLSEGPEATLAAMKKRGRRDVRHAMREAALTVTDETGVSRDEWSALMGLMTHTGDRQGFAIMTEDAYWSFITTMREQEVLHLLVAREAGEVVAWAIVTCICGSGTYYFAASSPRGRDLDAPDLLIWCAIETLCERGAVRFDLMGVGSDMAPSFAHLTRFKSKFAPELTRVQPDRELVLRRRYHLHLAAAKLRARLRR